MKFSELGLKKELLDKLIFEEATKIQEYAIPFILEERDVIGQAVTGSGKTLAYLLPVINMLEEDEFQVLIIVPTRELAIQVNEEANKISKSLVVYGGRELIDEEKKLKKEKTLILIGTPGRLLDHLKRKTIKTESIRFLIIDEADRLFDLGFQKDVERIILRTPRKRQTLMFSATIPKSVIRISEKYMRNPEFISTQEELNIKHYIIETKQEQKINILCNLIKEWKIKKAIIFSNTRKNASSISKVLNQLKFPAAAIHADFEQRKREKILHAFREGHIKYLVASDLAARGLDISGITHIINYECPQNKIWYSHRIGRTARMGMKGKAITLLTEEDHERFSKFGIKTKKLKVKIRQKFTKKLGNKPKPPRKKYKKYGKKTSFLKPAKKRKKH